MPTGITYYVVRDTGTMTRDLAIHRVFDSAVTCLQKIIRTYDTTGGVELWGLTADEYGIVNLEWLIASHRPGEKTITQHGHPVATRDYVFRQPGLPLRPPTLHSPSDDL